MKFKKLASLCLTSVIALGTLSGCGNSPKSSTSEDTASDEPITITVLTNRTNMVDTVFADYSKEYKEINPNVTLKWEAFADYQGTIQTRMSTTEYGDVLFIPSTLTLDQYPNFFAPLGTQEDMSKQYMFTDKYTVDDQTYAIPTGLNAQGFVYNAAVFEKAGITSLPTTPDEFIADLKLIKDNTDAIPLYTNYAADWPITNWSQLLLAMAGDTDYYNKRIYDANAYAEGSPLYDTYNMLYQAASQGLVETDPITSDWATSQQMLADGKVGILTIASWGVSQEQALSKTPEDIKLMPAPMQSEGKFNLEVAPDYAIAVNKNSKNVEASKEFVTWFVDRFVVDGGFVSPKVGAPTPDYMSEIPDVNLVQANPTSAEDATFQAKIEGDSGLGIYDPTWIKPIIELGIGSKEGTFDDYMNGLNEKWSEAISENK